MLLYMRPTVRKTLYGPASPKLLGRVQVRTKQVGTSGSGPLARYDDGDSPTIVAERPAEGAEAGEPDLHADVGDVVGPWSAAGTSPARSAGAAGSGAVSRRTWP